MGAGSTSAAHEAVGRQNGPRGLRRIPRGYVVYAGLSLGLVFPHGLKTERKTRNTMITHCTMLMEMCITCMAAVSAAFLAALVSGHWETDDLAQHLWSVLGLIAGGVVAAPLAGWMTKVLPIRALTWIVGLVVTGLAIWQAVVLFG